MERKINNSGMILPAKYLIRLIWNPENEKQGIFANSIEIKAYFCATYYWICTICIAD